MAVRLVAAALCLQFLAGPAHAEKIAFVGATVINPIDGSIIHDSVVVTDGDNIKAVGNHAQERVPADARRIDAAGKFIIPGLWDMHAHVAGIMADPKWSRDALLPLLVANGITGIRDMGGNLEALLEWRRAIAAGDLIGPHIITGGPFLADAKPGTPDTIPANPEQARRAVQDLKARHADFIKVLSKLSRESYFAIADEAKRQGLDFVGHVPDTITAREACASGQKSIEHIMYSGLTFDCSSKEEELRQQRKEARDGQTSAKLRTAANASFDSKKATNLWQAFKDKGTWSVPTLVGTYTGAFQIEESKDVRDPRLNYLPASVREKLTPEVIAHESPPEVAKWYQQQFENDLKLAHAMHAAGVPMLAGSDSLDVFNYPGSSLHQELKLLVDAGLTLLEALQTATSNPARFFGREQSGGRGRIAPGYLADLVILEANPLDDITNSQRIESVMIGGKLLDRSALDRLLAKARASVTAALP